MIQAKFFANYNSKKQQEAKQALLNDDCARKVSQIKPLNFDVKLPAPGLKRKKELECYINLPASFFNSFKGEDMSIFKVPYAKKRSKSPEPPPSVASCNLTMATVNSAAFKPNVASTPFEKPKPMISDPDEFRDCFRNSANKKLEVVPVRASAHAPAKVVTLQEKATKFMELVDKTAKNIDAKCFSNHADPIKQIQERLLEIYEATSRSPRIINETLMSKNDETPRPVEKKPKPLLPIPEFFEENHDKRAAKVTQDRLTRTVDIFNWTTKFPTNCDDMPSPVENNFSPQIISNRSAKIPASPTFSEMSFLSEVASPSEAFSFNSPQSNFGVDLGVEEMSPFNNFLMDFETPRGLNNTFAIFESPPEPQTSRYNSSQASQHTRGSQHHSQTQHRRTQKSSSSQYHRSSQRTQQEDIGESFHPANSSLSTYKWPPNERNASTMDLSHSPSFVFEPRKLFKNSFDFL